MKTLRTAIYPRELYVLKTKLGFEGIESYLFDENLININPFKSVALGGVRLIVADEDHEVAVSILEKTEEIVDDKVIENEVNKSVETLKLKRMMRKNELDLKDADLKNKLNFNWLQKEDIDEIIVQESTFIETKFNTKLSWESFWAECFDGHIFRFVKRWDTDYYLENDLIDQKAKKESEKDDLIRCSKCNSDNVAFGNTYTLKQNFVFLIFALLLLRYPWPAFKMRYHCFDCGHEFK